MRAAAIVGLLCLLGALGCRGGNTNQGNVPITREATPAPAKAEASDTTTTLGEAISGLLERFQSTNSRYRAGEITRDERVQSAEDFEQEAWSLVQRAKTLADGLAASNTDPTRAAYAQELALFQLLYVEDLHSALCSERMALQTAKAQWNKRARLQAQPLSSLANSIRWQSGGSISLPAALLGLGQLPAEPTAAKKEAATVPSEKATTSTPSKKTPAATPSKKATTGSENKKPAAGTPSTSSGNAGQSTKATTGQSPEKAPVSD